MSRRQRDLDQLARQHGFTFQRITGSGHRLYQHDDTGATVISGSTFSDVRARQNFLADLRRSNKTHPIAAPMPRSPACAPNAKATDRDSSGPGGRPPDTRTHPVHPHHRQAAAARRPDPVSAHLSGDLVLADDSEQPSTGQPFTVAQLTIGSLRTFTAQLPTLHHIRSRKNLQTGVSTVLAASSYLDTDLLLEIDFTEAAAMLADARPDLSDTSQATYLGNLRKVIHMLVDRTAGRPDWHHPAGDPYRTLRIKPDRKPTRAGTPAPVPTPAVIAIPAGPAVAAAAPADPVPYLFQIRPGLIITLPLPADLRKPEADRLAEFIRLLIP